MALFFVTGQAGTGKSTVCKELRARGYESYDTDDDGFARWVNKSTGYVHPKSSVKPTQRTPDFLDQHDWKVPREAAESLARLATDKTVILCGVCGNWPELSDLFTGGIALALDDETLTHRLQTRTTNNWGKSAHELTLTLGWQKQSLDDYHKYGHTIINASQPLDRVVDEVIQTIEASQPA